MANWMDEAEDITKDTNNDESSTSNWMDEAEDITNQEAALIEPPSQLEAVGRGALKGATLGLDEEIGSVTLTPFEMLRAKVAEFVSGTPENVDAQLREKGFTGDIERPGILETYRGLRDTTRDQQKTVEENYPTTSLVSEIGGAVVPGLLTGGASSVANVGKVGAKELIEQGLKSGAKYGAKKLIEQGLKSGAKYGAKELIEQGLKSGAKYGAKKLIEQGLKSGAKYGAKELIEQGLKSGAKYGAGYALGNSEADLTKGEFSDVAMDTFKGGVGGALIGGTLSAALPAARSMFGAVKEYAPVPFKDTSKFIKESYKMAKKGEKFVRDKFATGISKRQTKATGELLKANEKSMDISMKKIGEILKKGDDINFLDNLKAVNDMLLQKIKNFGMHTDVGKQVRTMMGAINQIRNKAIKRSESKEAILTSQEMFDMWEQTKEALYSKGVTKDTADLIPFIDDMKTILLNSLNPKSRDKYIKLMNKLEKGYNIKRYFKYKGPKLGDEDVITMDIPKIDPVETSAVYAKDFSRLSPIGKEFSKEATERNVNTVMGKLGKDKLGEIEESSTLLDLVTRGQKEVQKAVETGKLPKIPLSIQGAGVVMGASAGNTVRGLGALKAAVQNKSTSIVKELSKATPEFLKNIANKAGNMKIVPESVSKSLQELAEASPSKRDSLLFVFSQRESFRKALTDIIGLDKDK